jgi:alpha-D-ribose 1-methylphosphonate 5-triphosphate synthase subunit PhnH
VPADKLHRVSERARLAALEAALLAILDQQTRAWKQAQLAVREARTKLPSSHAHRLLLE